MRGLGLTQSYNQWVPGALYPGVKWQGNESAHISAFTAKVKYKWSYIVHTGAAETCFCYSFI
jgi:hypothetical protein